MKTVKKHFEKLRGGQLPLWKVFWVHLILLPVLLLGIAYCIIWAFYHFNGNSQPIPYPVLLLILLIPTYLLILYFPFITVMLSRCRQSMWVRLPVIAIGTFISAGYAISLIAPPICACGDEGPASNLAVVKEAASMVSGSYSAYKLEHEISSNTGSKDFEQFWNYVKKDTERRIDSVTGEASLDCSDSKITCLLLHNGGVMAYDERETFGGTDGRQAIRFVIDPDGSFSGQLSTAEDAKNVKAIALYQYADGPIRLDSTLKPGTRSSTVQYEPSPHKVPQWMVLD